MSAEAQYFKIIVLMHRFLSLYSLVTISSRFSMAFAVTAKAAIFGVTSDLPKNL